MRQLRPHYATWQDAHSSVVVHFPVPTSDGGLIKALEAGHPDALRALTERHSGELLRVAARILGPDAMLEAVVTKAMRRALLRIDSLEDPSRLKHWLTSNVVSAARRRIWVRRIEGWLRTRSRAKSLRSSVISVEPRYSEQLLATYRVLDRLNDDQRVIFCLVVIHSMSLAEAATLLDVSLITGRNLLDKACNNFVLHCQREPAIQRLNASQCSST